jgi:hypothetical protein
MHCARRPFAAGYRALRGIAFSGCGKALRHHVPMAQEKDFS